MTLSLSFSPSLLSVDRKCDWKLGIQRDTTIVDWAIELDLNGPFALSSGESSLSFTIDGEKVNSQGDILLSNCYCFYPLCDSPDCDQWT